MLQETHTILDNIYYISIPPEQEREIGSFKLNSEIKLPVETDDFENWNIDDLTWEMILSAMLKILAYAPEHENLDYYRDFIFAVKPNIINELSNSGVIKAKAKDFKLANEIFLAIEGLDPENDKNALNIITLQEEILAYKESIGEDTEEIIERIKLLYSTLLSRDKVLTDTFFNAGYFYIKVRNFEQAESCLQSFIEVSDDDIKIDQAKSLIREYKLIIDNEETFNNAYNAIINEEESLGISILETFLKENPKVWNGWFLLGWAYRRISNFTEAKTALLKATELNDKESDVYNELAICLMELKDFDASRSTLKQALTLNPDDIKIISNMGIVEMKAGNNELAKKFFEAVLILDPDDKIATKYLETL